MDGIDVIEIIPNDIGFQTENPFPDHKYAQTDTTYNSKEHGTLFGGYPTNHPSMVNVAEKKTCICVI
jgi:hypothetical protein